MADAVRRLLADLQVATMLGAMARETIVHGYSLDATARRYAELYRTFLAGRATRP